MREQQSVKASARYRAGRLSLALLALLWAGAATPANARVHQRRPGAGRELPGETRALAWRRAPFPAGWAFAGRTGWDENVRGDFNGDGRSDFARPGHDAVHLFLSRGDGTFLAARYPYPAQMRLGLDRAQRRLVAADFDGDGRADIAALEGRQVRVLFSRLPRDLRQLSTSRRGDLPASAFHPTAQAFPKGWAFLGPVWGWHRGVVGDFNGDGKADFARPSVLHTHVFLGRGDGTFDAILYRYPRVPGLSGNWWALGADIDGDGRDDLVLGDARGIHVLHARLDRNPNAIPRNVHRWIVGRWFRMASIALPPGAFPADAPLVGDFDGDRRADLLWVLKGAAMVLRGPDLRLGVRQHPPVPGPGQLVTGDLDGDGKVDVAAIDPTGPRLLLSRQPGQGFRVLPIRPDGRKGKQPHAISGDFDGDRCADLALLYPTGLAVSLMRDLRPAGAPAPAPSGRTTGTRPVERTGPISGLGVLGRRGPVKPSLSPMPRPVGPIGWLGVPKAKVPVAPMRRPSVPFARLRVMGRSFRPSVVPTPTPRPAGRPTSGIRLGIFGVRPPVVAPFVAPRPAPSMPARPTAGTSVPTNGRVIYLGRFLLVASYAAASAGKTTPVSVGVLRLVASPPPRQVEARLRPMSLVGRGR